MRPSSERRLLTMPGGVPHPNQLRQTIVDQLAMRQHVAAEYAVDNIRRRKSAARNLRLDPYRMRGARYDLRPRTEDDLAHDGGIHADPVDRKVVIDELQTGPLRKLMLHY